MAVITALPFRCRVIKFDGRAGCGAVALRSGTRWAFDRRELLVDCLFTFILSAAIEAATMAPENAHYSPG